DVGRLVVVDLGEDDVFLDADRVVAPAVEALRRQAAEVAHARQRNVDQPVDELVHARLAQRHLAADRLAVAHLECGDRLARLGDHRLLARDQAKVVGGRLDLLAIVDAFADAHIDDDLLQHGHLHAVLVAELLGQPLAHDLFEMGLQPRRDALLPLPRLGWRLLAALALGGLVVLLRLRALLLRLRLVALLGPRRLVRLIGLAWFGFGFGISHRSQLPNAWRPAPFAAPRLPRRP